MANIPIVVVAYDRLHSLKRITDSLLQAEYPQGAELIISIDRGDNRQVLEYADSLSWPFGEKRVIYRPENLGLNRHIPRNMMALFCWKTIWWSRRTSTVMPRSATILFRLRTGSPVRPFTITG